MENNDISNVYTFLIERWTLDSYLSNLNQTNELILLLDKFKKFDATTIKNIYTSLRQGRNIKPLLVENQYTQQLCRSDFEAVIKQSNVTPISAFIIFYNLFSFLYVNNDQASENDTVFTYNNPLPLDLFILIMKGFNTISRLQYPSNPDPINLFSLIENPTYYDKFVNFFFEKIINRSFSLFQLENHENYNQQQVEAIEQVFIFFRTQIRLPSKFCRIFLKFINEIRKNEFSNEILMILIKMYQEKRPIIDNDDRFHNLAGVVEFLQSFIQEFNSQALKLLSIISKNSTELHSFVIDAYSSIASAITSRIVTQDQPSIVFDPISSKVYSADDSQNPFQDRLLNSKFVETKSLFKDGFICPEIPMESIDWLLLKFDKKIRGFVILIKEFLLQTNENLLEHFFRTMNNVLPRMTEIYYSDCLVIFFEFLTIATKYQFISTFNNTVLNPRIFNEEENLFDSLSDQKNAFRNGAFSILSNQPETIASFVIRSSNPLFRAELLLRIQNRSKYSSLFVDSLDICKSLQLLDMQYHCESIEKARCVSFTFMCSLFLDMFNSYKHFEQVMSFCLEKNLTSIFVNLFDESTKRSKNFSLLHFVYPFVKKLFNISIDLSFKFIGILSDLFNRKPYLNHQIIGFFNLLMDFISISNLNNEMAFKATQLSLSYLTLFNNVNSLHLKLITHVLSKNMNNDVFETLLLKLGKPPKGAQKVNEFPIRYPIFLPVLLFSNGLTAHLMNYFIGFSSLSLKNLCHFHDQQIDIVLLQILQNKKDILYRNEVFENFYIDNSIAKSEIKLLFLNICVVKTDYHVISELLKNPLNIPMIDSILMGCYNPTERALPIPSYPIQCNNPIQLHHFSTDFTITFRIQADFFYLNLFPEERVELLTFKNGSLRFGIYFQSYRLKAYYSNGKTRSDVNLFYVKMNAASWKFIAIAYCHQQQELSTFCQELPMNKSDFVKIEFNDDNPIILTINNIFYNNSFLLRSTLQNKVNPLNLIQAYAFNRNEFIGYIREIAFYDKLLSIRSILKLASQMKSDPVLSFPNDFQVVDQHVDNIFHVLRRDSVIEKLSRMLVMKNQEENVSYYILDIIGRLVDSIEIPYVYLKLFFEDKNHFAYTKMFHCFYFSIYTNIKNPSNKEKFFDAFITNISVWLHYSNFRQIMYYFQTTVITDNVYLLSQKKYFIRFLSKVHKIDSKYWDQYIVILERLFDVSYTHNVRIKELAVLHRLSNRVNLLLRQSNSLKESNLKRVELTQKNPPLSLIERYFNCKRAQLMISSKQKDELPILKVDSSTYKKERRKSSLVDETEPEKTKTVDLTFDCPFRLPFETLLNDQLKSNNRNENDESSSLDPHNLSNSNNVNSNNSTTNQNDVVSKDDKLYIIYLLQLIHAKLSVFSKNERATSLLIDMLRINDIGIVKQVILVLYDISSSYPLSLFTFSVFDRISHNFFDEIFVFLTGNLEARPGLFPLWCAIAFSLETRPPLFETLQKYQSFSRKLLAKEINSRDSDPQEVTPKLFFLNEKDPWYFFPILLSFSALSDELPYLFNILAQTIKGNSAILDKMLVLYSLFSNFLNNDSIIAQFYVCLFNVNFHLKMEMILHSSMSLFIHPYYTNVTTTSLLTLLQKQFSENMFSYRLGVQINSNCSLQQFLLKWIDTEQPSDDEQMNNTIWAIKAIFSRESYSTTSFFEMSKICEKLISDYQHLFEDEISGIFSSLQQLIQPEPFSDAYKNVLSTIPKNPFETITISDHSLPVTKSRLSSQIDQFYRQMIYRTHQKPLKETYSINANSQMFKYPQIKSYDSYVIGIRFQRRGNTCVIKSETASREFDLNQDVRIVLKRDHSDIVEIFTKFGKSYRIRILDQQLANRIASSKLTEKKWNDYCKQWSQGDLTNFQFLMILNLYCDRIYNRRAIFPSPIFGRNCIPAKDWNYSQNEGNQTDIIIKDVNLSENHFIEAKYFYDFELYDKHQIKILYWLRHSLENCQDLPVFAEKELHFKIPNLRDPSLFRSTFSEIRSKNETLAFSVVLRPNSEQRNLSFLALNSSFYVKFYSSNKPAKTSSRSDIIQLTEATLYSALSNYPSNMIQNADIATSFILDNVNPYCKLFTLDDGIAAFDPIKRTIIMFTISPMDFLSAQPSELKLTSKFNLQQEESDDNVLKSSSSQNLSNLSNSATMHFSTAYPNSSPLLTPLILSTSIPGVLVKTYTRPILDHDVHLMCGNTERQFYTVSNNSIYTNNFFFTQLNSTIILLKVSMQFNILVAATEDGKVHIISSTSGKPIRTIDLNHQIDCDNSTISKSNQNERSNHSLNCTSNTAIEIIITYHFGFILVVTNNGAIHLFTTNGTHISSSELDGRHSSDNISFWFTFDTLKGLDYFGFITKTKEIYYCEAFYPRVFVQLTTDKKISNNIISIGYDKFNQSFILLKRNSEISVLKHKVLVCPINQ